jgi:cysteinyl-tRNA synthetase
MVLVFDTFRSYLEWSGLDVTFVSNITDIDDNIIKRANELGVSCEEVTATSEDVWWKAMDLLDVARPDQSPHATEYVEQMVDLIQRLLDADAAYVTSDGVYLSVDKVAGYGLLAHQSLDQLLEGGGDREIVGTEKKFAADFALWKFPKPGEPSWPAPWGEGRPGWHTECVVMSLDLLGEGFDLHTGGLDLTFPHHENERAQAVALGHEFATHWMHNGFVETDGQKMSKSLGNGWDLMGLATEYDPRAYRLLILQSHYRSPIEISDVSMRNAEAALDRLDAFARRTASSVAQADQAVVDEFKAIVDNDFDTSGGTDLMFRQVRDGNSALDAGQLRAASVHAANVREIAGAFRLRLVEDQGAPEDMKQLAAARTEARASKDFARADEIRDELAAAGWVVEDLADGPVLRRK